MSIIVGKQLSKFYGENENLVTALKDVDITVKKGEFISVMGDSGAGKSTLLNIVGGLDKPTQGQIYIEGVSLSELDDEALSSYRRNRVGFIFQSYNLIPTLNLMENIMLPVLLDNRSPNKKYINEIIEVMGLTNRIKHFPDQLSGGQQQRVAIARSLASNPAIILADEPTGNLDNKSGNIVLDLLNRCVKEYKQTVIMVTHNLDNAKRTDRTIYIKDGELISS